MANGDLPENDTIPADRITESVIHPSLLERSELLQISARQMAYELAIRPGQRQLEFEIILPDGVVAFNVVRREAQHEQQ